MEGWQTVLQGGAAAVLLLFLYGFRAGWWRTKQEVDAWETRTLRAEKLVDELIPQVREQTAQVNNLTASMSAILAELRARDREDGQP